MRKMILTAVLCAFIAAPAMADFTMVYDTTWNPMDSTQYPNLPDEWDLVSGLPTYPGAPGPHGGGTAGAADILDTYYGAWVRVDDDFDKFWRDTNGGLTVTAKYTSQNLTLGYSADEYSPSWQTLSLKQAGDTGIIDLPDGDYFIWGINGKYSNPALNPGGKDHFVTYRITKLLNGSSPDVPTFVFGFEDGTDNDYQDFVWEATHVVPVPGAVLLGLLGLSAAGIKLRKFA